MNSDQKSIRFRVCVVVIKDREKKNTNTLTNSPHIAEEKKNNNNNKIQEIEDKTIDTNEQINQ